MIPNAAAGDDPRPRILRGFRDRLDVVRRRAAATAKDVRKSTLGKITQQLAGFIRRLVVLSERIREAGVRVRTDPARRNAREFRQVRPHVTGAERAVDADRPGTRMLHREIERVHRLTRQRASALVGDRERDHQGQHHALLVLYFLNGDDRRFGIERVDDRFEQQNVNAAVDQTADLIDVRVFHFVERDVPKRGVVHVWRDRQRAIGRPHRSGDDARPGGPGGGDFVGDAAGKPRGFEVHLVGKVLEVVVRLRHHVRVERVRLENICAGVEVLPMNSGDDLRLCQRQKIVIAAKIARVRGEARAAIVGFGKRVALDHRAHRAVQDQNAIRGEGVETFE